MNISKVPKWAMLAMQAKGVSMSNEIANNASFIFAGKKPKFLNLVYISCEGDIQKLPEDVRTAVSLEPGGAIRVESREYANGELIPLPAYIAWEKEDKDKERCPHGWNLWNKANASAQLSEGFLEEVDGKLRQTKIVPLKAQLFTGEIPEIFLEMPRFDGQVTVENGNLFIKTPWGISNCKAGNGFAIVYGLGNDAEKPKFFGMLDGNILTVGTASFEDYYHVTEDGKVIETLREYFESLH